ncbi:leucyl/phenylalanyl-tRNA--protein transferase [Roseospira visakhapatnamensis]|uniref:Leucyl/phenylalanyl-tRNA--protein transferase n=1 Tax=Roseospira visakhapatnamensis TaxID=390880 RepID=A0A7W6W9M5_9PROT|nr:leucyl/phenylalanyl-tRNA--protein transferase [Roseospira visakhapatnamensis]MBB4265626.1 leucyl/phenylalanyl-tRNA--protein transferase [Roseospira visakhapatnamensis]
MTFQITPDILLRAYATGLFPMARGRDDPNLYWVDPERRGILPLTGFHVPRSLRKTLRQGRFEVRVDTAFLAVLRGCAAPMPGRPDTWINAEIEALFTELHARGTAHSIECWRGDRLVGGLYGLALAGAFFGESMFSTESDASKVALCHLVARLVAGGFTLLDTQFITDHLARFGAREVTRATYLGLLDEAMQTHGAQFYCAAERVEGAMSGLLGITGGGDTGNTPTPSSASSTHSTTQTS